MNVEQAEAYLEQMFGSHRGHVAVAYKDKGQSWQEHQFAWPREKRKLLGWAKVHEDANVFICPALRADGHTRKKNDGTHLRWLWADVDFDKVPAMKVDTVHERIRKVGTYVVASGTGDNAHVYVDLGEEVPVAEFTRLNTGLRDYLYGDNKQADNSLLRLPGMTNWKTDAGKPVAVRGGHGRPVRRDVLMKARAFREAQVIRGVDDYDWEPVDVSKVSGRWKRLAKMDVEEAVGRWGSRHKAVWAVAGELHKAGLTSDQIHTLMDTFPAALDKMDSENGYDLHKDVEKRLQYEADREVSPVKTVEDDDGEAIEELSDEEREQTEEEEKDAEAEKLVRKWDIESRAKRLKAERGFTAPPPDAIWTVSEALKNPPKPIPHLIQGLAGANHNVVITAQYKTGKTTFMMGTLIQALVDGTPFLGEYEVLGGQHRVMHWNCEMEAVELLDEYIRPVGLENPDNLQVANLRGHAVNILSEMGREYAINQLKAHRATVWTIDSLARLARMAGVAEKDNDEMLDLLMAIDHIKEAAGVKVSFTIAHTGRAEMEEGKERARGATVIDDWPDARWIMTKDGEARFLNVEGRGVRLETTALAFDPATGRSTRGIGDKSDVRAAGGVQAVATIVTETPGINQSGLEKRVKEAMKCGAQAARDFIEEAVEAHFIPKPDKQRGTRGGRPAKVYQPWPKPESGGATPRMMNLKRS